MRNESPLLRAPMVPFYNTGNRDVPPFGPVIITGMQPSKSGKNSSFIYAGRSAEDGPSFAELAGPERVAISYGAKVEPRAKGQCVISPLMPITVAVEEETWGVDEILIAQGGHAKLKVLDQGQPRDTDNGVLEAIPGDFDQIYGVFRCLERLRSHMATAHLIHVPRWMIETSETTTKLSTSVGRVFAMGQGGLTLTDRCLSFYNPYARVYAGRKMSVGLMLGRLMPVSAEC